MKQLNMRTNLTKNVVATIDRCDELCVWVCVAM